MAYYFGDTMMADSSVVYTQLENSLTAASAAGGPYPGLWTFVESFSVTRSAVAYTVRVWKCSGTVNDWGVDYYALFGYPTATPTSVYLTICEQYDSATHKLFYPAVSTSVALADGSSSGASSGILLSDATTSGPNWASWVATTLTANTQADWYVSITKRHLAFSLSSAAGARGAFIVGGHPPFPGYTQAQMPTMWFTTFSVSSSSSGATRAGANGVTYPSTGPFTAGLTKQGVPCGAVSSSGPMLDRFTLSVTGTPVLVGGNDIYSGPSTSGGGYSGLLRCTTPVTGLLTFTETSPGSPRNGDRVTVGGKTYARFGNSSTNGGTNSYVQSVYIDESL